MSKALVFKYEVSDLVLRARLIRTGLCGHRAQRIPVLPEQLSPAARQALVQLGYDLATPRNHHYNVPLAMPRLQKTPAGLRLERIPVRIDAEELSIAQLERVLIAMAESKQAAEAAIRTSVAASAARARRTAHQALVQLNTLPGHALAY